LFCRRRIKKTREQLKKGILPLLERYEVRRASLFGSAARGEDRPDGDIDILVELPDSCHWQRFPPSLLRKNRIWEGQIAYFNWQKNLPHHTKS
jgi:predicted nucleotidyltransferase